MNNGTDSRFEPTGSLDYFKKAIRIIKLDQEVMAQVARDANALSFGLTVTAMGGALAFVPGDNLTAVLVGALYSVLILFLFAGFVHLCCGYSKDKEEFMGFVRVVGLSGVLDWAIIIPTIGMVAAVWSLVVSIVATQSVYQVTRGRASVVVLISAIILWTVSAMIFAGPLSFLDTTQTQP